MDTNGDSYKLGWSGGIVDLRTKKCTDLCVNQDDMSKECRTSLDDQKEEIQFYHSLVQDVDDYFQVFTCVSVENHTYIPIVRVRKLKRVPRMSY